jgi:tRNA(Ile)-lysidine synthase
MLAKLKDYIHQHKLLNEHDRLLLGVSGGVDSMVLLHLFQQLPYSIAVAHVNFGLRGVESDEDEEFVVEYCQKHNIKAFTYNVDTLAYVNSSKVSIQMAARTLRYNWFEKLKIEHQFKHLLTAHHSDDSVETIFINILRGTGISGLKGITSNENAIRPLLSFTRAEIIDYANSVNLVWREDSSNAKEDYLRNKLRHSILPMFDSINDTWRQKLVQLSDDISVSENVLTDYYNQHLPKFYSDARIQLAKLNDLDFSEWMLRRLLISLGFTHQTISDIILNLEIQKGKMYESSTFILQKEEDAFRVIAKDENQIEEYSAVIIEEQNQIEFSNSIFDMGNILVSEFNGKYREKESFLDYNKLDFPLLIRKWQAGDWFVPFGMKGRKKLSDYFVDEKFTIQEKENTFVIVSGEDIVCILGHRIDDRYSVNKNTTIIYHIKQKHG